MRKCRASVKTALCALAMVAGGASLAAAQEVSLSNLALKNTYLKTRSDTLGLSWQTPWTNIFSPTTIRCPGTSGTCTARIEVSVVFKLFHHDDFPTLVPCRVVRGRINAPTVALPADVGLLLTQTLVDGTFTWIAPGLPVGSTAFSVQCRLIAQPAQPITAVQRTLTIDVYKP